MRHHRQHGVPCPSGMDHGSLLLMSSGRWHCPHIGHDREQSQHTWSASEVGAWEDELRASLTRKEK